MQIISYLQASEQLYALVTKSLIQIYSFFENFGAIISQDFNQTQTVSLCPTAKGLSLFTAFLSSAKKKKKKKEKAIQILKASKNLVMLGTQARGKRNGKGKQI